MLLGLKRTPYSTLYVKAHFLPPSIISTLPYSENTNQSHETLKVDVMPLINILKRGPDIGEKEKSEEYLNIPPVKGNFIFDGYSWLEDGVKYPIPHTDLRGSPLL